MNYTYLLKYPKLFPSVIGITYRQFESILPKFSRALRIAEHEKAYQKERIRIPGGGRKPTLKTDRQKLFFILFYYKIYPTFALAQLLFEMHESNVYRWKEFLEPVLFKALEYQLELPKTQVKGLTGVFEICPSLRKFIVDATERQIQRPKDSQKQKEYYSGKRKQHTVKNQILVHPHNKRILAVSKTVNGKMHDKKLLERDPNIYRAPPRAKILGDLGYQGANELNPFTRFVTPIKKKPKEKELSETDKATNKALSSLRVRVEHPFSYLKHFAILTNRFRGHITKTHQPFVNVACVYNFTRPFR